MPGTQSLCRTMRPGRIPFRAVKANRFAPEFRSPTISHASDRDRLDLIISVGTHDGVSPDQEAKADIVGDYDFRNRIYNPTLGRWLTHDPIGFNAGDVNTFRYVGNGPGNGSNASGLQDLLKYKPVIPGDIDFKNFYDPRGNATGGITNRGIASGGNYTFGDPESGNVGGIIWNTNTPFWNPKMTSVNGQIWSTLPDGNIISVGGGATPDVENKNAFKNYYISVGIENKDKKEIKFKITNEKSAIQALLELIIKY